MSLRKLGSLGDKCQNWLDCDGNLICCSGTNTCRYSCSRASLNEFVELNGRCFDHFQCSGNLLCCPDTAENQVILYSCQQSVSGQCQ